MFRKCIGIGLAVMLGFALLSSGSPTFAATGGSPTATTFACDQATVTHNALTWDRDNTGSGSEAYTISIVDGNGVSLYSLSTSAVVGTALAAGSEDFVYTTAPTANPIRLTLTSLAGNGFGEQLVWLLQGDCAGLPTVDIAGPGVPDGFVLVYLTCSTAVFSEPAGTPVSTDAVYAGQGWYVNPKAVVGSDGRSWTEIFVSSTTNPYIPSSCVPLSQSQRQAQTPIPSRTQAPSQPSQTQTPSPTQTPS